MKYVKVKWIHQNPDDPIWLFSELDDASREIRKVEIFSDGTFGFAGEDEEIGGSWLGLELIPSIAEIAADPQFIPSEIDSREFEEVWERRLERPRKTGS